MARTTKSPSKTQLRKEMKKLAGFAERRLQEAGQMLDTLRRSAIDTAIATEAPYGERYAACSFEWFQREASKNRELMVHLWFAADYQRDADKLQREIDKLS